MTRYKKWDIVLVPFPYTNLLSSKQRPALILSPNEYNQNSLDMLAVAVTSQITGSFPYQYSIINWKESGLPKASVIKMKFTTLEQNLIIKSIGSLSLEDRKGFLTILENFLELNK